jgi:hypothetical protein
MLLLQTLAGIARNHECDMATFRFVAPARAECTDSKQSRDVLMEDVPPIAPLQQTGASLTDPLDNLSLQVTKGRRRQ